MHGLSRLGGNSKYKTIDGSLDLMPPIMVADPSRNLKPDPISLSYNNMLMRQDGGIMSHEHIKEMRERQGYCLTCPNEPVQLFEIKKSKINPLFRSKEAIDSIHVSYNGICLKCNPQLDPHLMIRREHLQKTMSQRSSMGTKNSSMDLTNSRSRSNSPDNGQMFTVPAGEGQVASQLRKFRKSDSIPKRDKTRLQAKHLRDDVFSPGRLESKMSSRTAFMSQETPISTRDSERSLGTFGTPVSGITEFPPDWTPGSNQASGGTLGAMLKNNKPPINKANLDEFSMPDFSQGSTAFKSHRKSSIESGIPLAPALPKSTLKIVKEESRRESSSFNFSHEDVFGDFGKSSFLSSDINNHSSSRKQTSSSKKKKNLSRIEPKVLSDSAHSFFDETRIPTFGKNDARLNDFPRNAIRQDSNPFQSESSESDAEKNENWSTFRKPNENRGDWPASPSIQSDTAERQVRRRSASHTGSDYTANLSKLPTSNGKSGSLSLESSDSSLNFHEAVRMPNKSGHDSMTPSQLIEADEQLMLGISGIRIEAPIEITAGSTAEVEELKSLLEDIVASGISEILIDTIVGTIREHANLVPIQEICLKHIWDHSKFNEAHKSSIMDAGIDVDIFRAMKSHRRAKMLQKNACGCIWSLSVNEQIRPRLARVGAAKLLFLVLEDFIEDEEVLEIVFGALRTLSPDKEFRDSIVPLLGARRVCRAMGKHRSSTPIQRDGCAFLSNAAVDIENQMVSNVHHDELSAVVRCLGDHLRNESVVSSACFALKNYTYEEKNLRSLRRFEEVIPLLEDVSKYSTKAEIRFDAAEIIERIQLSGQEDDELEEIAYSSLRDAMQDRRMTVDVAVETIRDVMKQYEWSEKLLVFGLGSLLSLSRQSEEYMTRITQFDVLKVIVHTMYKQQANPNIQHRGCETIKFLAEQGNRPRTMICDVDGSSILISALRFHRNNEVVKSVAIAALEELSKDPRCANLVSKELFDDDRESSLEFGNSLASFGESFRTQS
jgi:hypothetical protein